MTLRIGTSWKMTKTLAEARDWAGGLRDHLGGRAPAGVLPFVVPPATALAAVHMELGADCPVLLGVQDAHWEDAGAWTGEISVPQAADAGAGLVEIGHSERREHFGETVERTRRKVAATLRHGLVPLLCVGEDLAVKEAGDSAAFVLDQVAGALDGLGDEELARVVIAYEPIWAIGEHGRPATTADLEAPVTALGGRWTGAVAGLLYGGSVHPGNAAELLTVPHVTGLFVGRAAWELPGYLEILRIATDHAARS